LLLLLLLMHREGVHPVHRQLTAHGKVLGHHVCPVLGLTYAESVGHWTVENGRVTKSKGIRRSAVGWRQVFRTHRGCEIGSGEDWRRRLQRWLLLGSLQEIKGTRLLLGVLFRLGPTVLKPVLHDLFSHNTVAQEGLALDTYVDLVQ